MKQLLSILILLIMNVGSVYAQGQHGVIRRRPNHTIGKSKNRENTNRPKDNKKTVTKKIEKRSPSQTNIISNGNIESANQRVINSPFTTKRDVNDVIIVSVILNSHFTAVNMSVTSYALIQWISIKSNTYIKAQERTYFLTEAKGIDVEPKKTYFTSIGQTINFTLYFAPIPLDTQSIDLIEPGTSKWKFYGIELK